MGLVVVALDGTRTTVTWDDETYEYLATAGWDAHGPLLSVQPRDQREVRTLAVDPATGRTTTLHSQTDPVWVENVPGVPARTASGALVRAEDSGGARRLVVGDTYLTGPELQVRGVVGIDGETVLFRASTEPTSVAVYSVTPGSEPVAVTPTTGVHAVAAAGAPPSASPRTSRRRRTRRSSPPAGGAPGRRARRRPRVRPGPGAALLR